MIGLEAKPVGKADLVLGQRLALVAIKQHQACQRIGSTGADSVSDLGLMDGLLDHYRHITLDRRQLRRLMNTDLLDSALLELVEVQQREHHVLGT